MKRRASAALVVLGLLLASLGVLAAPAGAAEGCAGLTQRGVRFVLGPDGKANVGSIRVFQNTAKTGWCVESRRINSFKNTKGNTDTSYQSTKQLTYGPDPFTPTTRTVNDGKNLHTYRFAAKKNARGKPFKCLWFQLSVQKGTGTGYGAANAACFK